MTNRPLSPHLQIYKPQMTSVLSILHRGTGIIIALGAIIIAWWLWSIAVGGQSFTWSSAFLNSTFGTVVMFLWTACTSYHLLNGIRHLVWDFGYGYELSEAYLSGKLVLAGTIILTAMVWLL